MYAAVSKLMDVEKFQIQMGQSPLLTRFADVLAWAVPIIEILISLALVFQRYRLLALLASFGLMSMFTVYIIFILNFSPFVPCSCGGILQDLGWQEHLIFNTFFIILGAIGVIIQSKHANQTNKNYIAT